MGRAPNTNILKVTGGPHDTLSMRVNVAQLVAASAQQARIDIEIVREDKVGYWPNVWNKKPWSVSYWGDVQPSTG